MARGGSGGITALRRHSIGVRTGQVRRALLSLAPFNEDEAPAAAGSATGQAMRSCWRDFFSSLETSIFSQRFSGDFQPPLQLYTLLLDSVNFLCWFSSYLALAIA